MVSSVTPPPPPGKPSSSAGQTCALCSRGVGGVGGAGWWRTYPPGCDRKGWQGGDCGKRGDRVRFQRVVSAAVKCFVTVDPTELRTTTAPPPTHSKYHSAIQQIVSAPPLRFPPLIFSLYQLSTLISLCTVWFGKTFAWFCSMLSLLRKQNITRQSKHCGFSIYIFDNSKSKSMVRLVRAERMVLSGLVFARKIARMILI